MKYFNLLPRIEYASSIITNLFYTYSLLDPIDSVYLSDYRIKTGETLASIASEKYDNARLWWVLALINNIHDPIFGTLLEDDIIRLDARNQATTNDVLDETKFLEIYEELSDQNEARRDIKVLSFEYLNTFLSDIVSISPSSIEDSIDIDEYVYEAIVVKEYNDFFEATGNLITTI